MKRLIGMSILMALFVFGLQLAPVTNHDKAGATDSLISMTDFGPSIASAGTFATNLGEQWGVATTMQQNAAFGNSVYTMDKNGFPVVAGTGNLPSSVAQSINDGVAMTTSMATVAGFGAFFGF